MMFDADIQPSDAMTPTVYAVRTKRWELDGVATITLASQENSNPLPAPAPGQFAMLYAFGVGEIPISYSSLSANGEDIRFTIRNVGAVSAALTQLKRGETAGVRGPFGVGWPINELEGRDVIIVAGGLGLAPLRPVIANLVATANKDRNLNILYGARDPDAILFRKDIERWNERSDVKCRVIVDTAQSDWRGEVGLVTDLIAETTLRPDRTNALICGPEVMMRFSAETLVDAGLPQDALWLSMERNMKCAIAFCGHCQFGAKFICKDGPVFRYDQIRASLFIREL